MSASRPTSASNIGQLESLAELRSLLDEAREVTLPTGSTVAISKVDMWDNQMPGASAPGGANISLLLSAPDAQPVRVHVVRLGADGANAAPPEWEDHHEWVPAPAALNIQEAEDKALADGTTFIVRPPGFFIGEIGTRVQGWRGPDWDGHTRYVAVVELVGGIRVQSEEQELQVVF